MEESRTTLDTLKEKKEKFFQTSNFDQQVLEDIVLQEIELAGQIENLDDRALTALSIYEDAYQRVFQHNKQIFQSKLAELQFAAEDITPVLFSNLQIYEKLIDIYAQCSYPEQIYELVDSLKNQKSVQNRVRLLLNSEVKSKQVDEEVIMKKIVEEEEEEKSGNQDEVEEKDSLEQLLAVEEQDMLLPVFQSPNTYLAIINACSKLGKMKQVIAMFEFMKRNRINIDLEAYNAIIASFVPQGQIVAALHFYEQILVSNMKPTAEICTNLLKCFLVAENDRYETVYESALQQGVQVNKEFLHKYIECICRISKDGERAREIMKQYENQFEFDIEDYNLILEACTYTDSIILALEIYEQLLSNPNHLYRPTIKTFNLMLTLFGKQGDKRTEILYHKMKEEKKSGNIAYANFVPNTETFNALIMMNVHNHDIDSAKQLLTAMRAQGVEPDVTSHNLLLVELHNSFWRPKMEKKLAKKKSIFRHYAFSKKQNEQTSASSSSMFMNDLSEESLLSDSFDNSTLLEHEVEEDFFIHPEEESDKI